MPTVPRISSNAFLNTISGLADMIGEQNMHLQDEYCYPTINAIQIIFELSSTTAGYLPKI